MGLVNKPPGEFLPGTWNFLSKSSRYPLPVFGLKSLVNPMCKFF